MEADKNSDLDTKINQVNEIIINLNVKLIDLDETLRKVKKLEMSGTLWKDIAHRERGWRWVCYFLSAMMFIVVFCFKDSIINGN